MNENHAVKLDPGNQKLEEGVVGPFLADMVRRWERGERPGAIDYLDAHPELECQSDVVLRLIYEEICLRQEHEEELSQDALLERFPRWRKELEQLLECHRILASATFEDVSLNETKVAGYTLVAELGQGRQGRVYLARQEALDDRPVVLKISPCRGNEHLTLARLQHTSIVPLYAAEEDPAEKIRILCMPYFGGTTLRELLVHVQGLPFTSRRGSDLLAALDRIQATLPIQLQTGGSARKFLASASYEQAIGWMGFCLAEALQFAHDRGYIHLDIKPANILLTADGQPMLLDFHIAQQPLTKGSKVPPGFGGTPAYMSPEQRSAVKASDINQLLTSNVDGRSDIFSLGLVLFETLGGSLPHNPEQVGKGPDPNRLQVAPGLKDILARCLAENPADRYTTAADLAEDLRRHVQDLPLKGVRNRSLIERWRKWRRRQPAAFPLAIMVTAVLMAALSLVLASVRHSHDIVQQAEHALMEGRQNTQHRRYAEAMTVLQKGVHLAESAGNEPLLSSLNEELEKAKRAHLAEKIHALAEVFRFHGSDPNLRGNLKEMDAGWSNLWEQRTWLTAPPAHGLSPDEQQRLKFDFLDLALIWSDLQFRLAPPEQKRFAQRQALSLLKEAETEFGQSPVISLQRQELEEYFGNPTVVPKVAHPKAHVPVLRTPWEHYALGRFWLERGELEEANELFGQAVELDPRGYWPRFYQGLCALQRHDYAEAEATFRVCVALAPESAACYYNHGLALSKLDREPQAIVAFSRALQFDPRLGAAAFHRGVLNLRAKSPQEAIDNFNLALNCGHDPASVHYHLAMAHLAQGNRPAALANGKAALHIAPGHKGARALLMKIEGK